ncbi:unannotated protein [freshwater metagenome]|uniref:Unannotated protein n=1 Tax=freshwater metagenome TaxID=449393 RepID=A0A6J7DA96_9ZZZZ
MRLLGAGGGRHAPLSTETHDWLGRVTSPGCGPSITTCCALGVKTGRVAKLLPADFDLNGLEHSERRVCAAFVDGLDDSWSVVPNVPIYVDREDREIDIVLVSPTHGVIAVEVKGGVIAVNGGTWVQNGVALRKTPMAQVVAAKHCLVKRMRRIGIELNGLFMCHVVALPDVGSVPVNGLGPDAPNEIIFAKPQLAGPAAAIARLQHENGPIPLERLARFLSALRPDIVLDGGEGDTMQTTARHLDHATFIHLAAVRELDVNRRVLVTGGAGTGKTWLAVDWARRAVARGERTLVVCFNKPIAEQLQRSLDGTSAMVGTYHDIAVRLLEPQGFRVGASPTAEYWEHVPTEALAFHADKVGTPFDTIIIDEGQDIRPHWMESLELLLDPAGARRLLVTADPAQAIYVKPWRPPNGMIEMPLVHNLRNSRSIADLVRRLGGPEPMPNAPGRMPVSHITAGGRKEVRKRVRDTIARLTEAHGVPLCQIAVLTMHASVRDDLIADPPDGYQLVRWEDRCEEGVLCETVHRAKGLERTAVILVDASGEPDRTLLYVGASRAVSSLTLIGSPGLAHVAGMPEGVHSGM